MVSETSDIVIHIPSDFDHDGARCALGRFWIGRGVLLVIHATPDLGARLAVSELVSERVLQRQ